MIINNTKPIRVETEDGWIVALQHAPWSDVVELWIGQAINGKFFSASVNKDGYLKLTEAKEGGEPQAPTIRVNARIWEGIANALRGVTPEIDKKEVDAELKATKYHLEDIRKIAKLK